MKLKPDAIDLGHNGSPVSAPDQRRSPPTTYRIAVLPGDGIGPEITDVAMQVLEHVTTVVDGLRFDLMLRSAGASHYRKNGVALPDGVLADCLAADAVLLSAIGLPDVRRKDGTEVQPEMMVGLRRALNLYAAARPVRLYPGVESEVRNTVHGIDMVIVRENLEGLFASFDGGTQVDGEVATDTIVITRAGTRRVVDFAFRLAQKRLGRPTDRRRVVTCVDKANVFRSFAFFRKVFTDVAAEYEDVEAETMYVDAACLHLIQNPGAFDVLVMENQFGDILSDLGAALVGGLGLGPSAEIGDNHALFQPAHGSAPPLAGRNIANPMALILSAAMMLDWLGDRYGDRSALKAATLVENGVAKVLAEGDVLTPDLGGRATTKEVGQEIINCIC
ncbi:isocitrate/isopropylmalate dehydrogenase family protein [Bythopirellula polymerisocia]|uniref:3-isopropylmalate dehydrogenase n=1 Tax=Bythopirellula polymerisocia TaxID=2528003 RepID=A0A5C6CUP8_9BACT|nr:isocitrate/isopropylmalate dehydrogenase family protein [Bythopirellula polymerisocia]TWU28693.1 3-isopropylmalate dehydrogenase [Bythopirellula polymerisocia]